MQNCGHSHNGDVNNLENITDIHIFGDSFADPIHEGVCVMHTWTSQLARYYGLRLTNHALMGTGPEYSLQRMFETPAPPEGSVCIFIVSDVDRMNLHRYWSSPSEQVHLTRDTRPFSRQLIDHYLVEETYLMRTAQSIAAVNSMSINYARTLILSISPVPVEMRLDPSVVFVNQGLLELSHGEYSNLDPNQPYVDSRPNHFSRINHDRISQELINWIDNSVTPKLDLEQEIIQFENS